MDTMNVILESVENLNQSAANAELETILALSNAYAKMYSILEHCDANTDISEFDIFQEASIKTYKPRSKIDRELNSDPIGYKSESLAKRILMFLPRLITFVIKLALGIITLLLSFVGSLIAVGGALAIHAINAKRDARDKEDMIELNFNLEFVFTTVMELTELLKYICDRDVYNATAMTYDDKEVFGWEKDNEYNLALAIHYAFYRDPALITNIEKNLEVFDDRAYEPTEMTRYDAKNTLKEIKSAQKKLNKYTKMINKFASGNYKADTDSEDDKDLERETERFRKVMTTWAEKGSELAKRLKALEQEAKTANSKIKDIEPEELTPADESDLET